MFYFIRQVGPPTPPSLTDTHTHTHTQTRHLQPGQTATGDINSDSSPVEGAEAWPLAAAGSSALVSSLRMPLLSSWKWTEHRGAHARGARNETGRGGWGGKKETGRKSSLSGLFFFLKIKMGGGEGGGGGGRGVKKESVPFCPGV